MNPPRWCLAALWIACLFASGRAGADDSIPPSQANWSGRSPDGKYLAATREEPDKIMVWREDLDRGVIVVVDKSGNYVRYDLGRLCAQIGWSPDSQFLVMTTFSAGGHSPWHSNAYAYSVQDRTLREMDPVIGLVVSPAFTFVGPHQIRIAIDPPNLDFSSPIWTTVDLAQKFSSLPEARGRQAGNDNLP